MQRLRRRVAPVAPALVAILAAICVSASAVIPVSAGPPVILGDGSVRLLGDGSVRFLTAGPVRLGLGGSAETRLLLPAVRGALFEIAFLGESGEVLTRRAIEPPAGQSEPLFLVSFNIAFTDPPGENRIPMLEITDGTSNESIHSRPSSKGIIAVLIGLLLPAVRPQSDLLASAYGGSLQVLDPAGNLVFILPYIEQDNLFRR